MLILHNLINQSIKWPISLSACQPGYLAQQTYIFLLIKELNFAIKVFIAHNIFVICYSLELP